MRVGQPCLVPLGEALSRCASCILIDVECSLRSNGPTDIAMELERVGAKMEEGVKTMVSCHARLAEVKHQSLLVKDDLTSVQSMSEGIAGVVPKLVNSARSRRRSMQL